MSTENPTTPKSTRLDVGYKRPPAEHQFKAGQKPPPRKPKPPPPANGREMLWGLLQEQRRVTTNGKTQWMTVAQIIMMQAHSLAENGNAACQRLLASLMLSTSEPYDGSDEIQVVTRD
jgi:hypothetical protein